VNLRDLLVPPMTDEEFEQQVKLVQTTNTPWPFFTIMSGAELVRAVDTSEQERLFREMKN